MTLKTTKEQRDKALLVLGQRGPFYPAIGADFAIDLCHDANRARELEEEVARLDSGWTEAIAVSNAFYAQICNLERENAELRAKLEEAAYLKHRLNTIIPIFQEARDALTALTMAQVKLRGISSSLADRMDDAGTYNREKYDAEQRALKEQEKV